MTHLRGIQGCNCTAAAVQPARGAGTAVYGGQSAVGAPPKYFQCAGDRCTGQWSVYVQLAACLSHQHRGEFRAVAFLRFDEVIAL